MDDALQIKAPRSFVISQGTIISKLKKLVKDIRKIMEPFTATHLQVYYSFVLHSSYSLRDSSCILSFHKYSQSQKIKIYLLGKKRKHIEGFPFDGKFLPRYTSHHTI